KHHCPFCDRLLPPLLAERGERPAARNPRRRRCPVARAWLPPTTRRSRQARLRLGQMGNSHRGQRHEQVVAAAVAAPVKFARGSLREASGQAIGSPRTEKALTSIPCLRPRIPSSRRPP